MTNRLHFGNAEKPREFERLRMRAELLVGFNPRHQRTADRANLNVS
jgi:hypothetical protein